MGKTCTVCGETVDDIVAHRSERHLVATEFARITGTAKSDLFARALVRELVEALREIDDMPDEPPEGYPAEAPDWLLYSRERMSAIARSARLKARAAGYTEEGE